MLATGRRVAASNVRTRRSDVATATWAPPTQCEMLQVLSHLSAVSILGDHTKWHESVSLDSPQFVADCKTQVPLFCTCSADNLEEKDLGCQTADKMEDDVVILPGSTLRQDTVMSASI